MMGINEEQKELFSYSVDLDKRLPQDHPLRKIKETIELREIGEWMALGFYEGQDLPWPRSYGLAWRRLYENMEIRVMDRRLLFPAEPLPRARTRDTDDVWHAESLLCDFEHNRGLRVNEHLAEEKKKRFPDRAVFIDELIQDLKPRLPHFGGYTHSNPDVRRVVNEGFRAMVAELDGELAAVEALKENADAGELNLLLALKDYATGVETFYARTLHALQQAAAGATGTRREELEWAVRTFGGCFLTPAQTFEQGLMAVHFVWMLDGCDSIGRLDQVLGPLLEQDKTRGTLDMERARRLLDEMWTNFERFNGWNLQIGGYTSEGKDGTNALTMECLAACGRNHVRRPNVAFRITKETPKAAILLAMETLGNGAGRPALYNDDLYVKTLREMDLGLTEEDSREIGFGGCTETMIPGLSNVGSLDGEINLAKALERALHDGADPADGTQVGPHTGRFETFSTFEDFMGAVKRQIQHMTDATTAWLDEQIRERFRRGDPKLCRTMFTRDCVKRRKSFEAGGARYNWSVLNYQGIANLVDSLAAVRACVFGGNVGKRELLQALAADFVGYDEMRRKLQMAPKFGNDLAAVDAMAADVLHFAWNTLYQHETPRGGRYLASCILFVTYAAAGKPVGALPDGRKAGEVLTDSAGPAQGRDQRGPTAMLSSVASLPLWLAAGTPVVNIRLQKAMLATPTGVKNAVSLVRSFFLKGGMQLQVSVIRHEEMLAAQREPEKHGNLIVRIGGYSEYFTRLDRSLQDSVIARTEHTA